ncbi:MAG: EamA family transporter [Candidatus Dadabacteria bacterium]|nr:MAG: EamA family transporter [Candidatus Dadabacteria bacterium]
MGVVAAFIAAAFASARDLTSKKITFKLDGTLNTFGSFAFALPFYLVALIIAYFAGMNVFDISSAALFIIVLRSLSDSCAEWTRMQALTLSDISLVVPFLALAPVFLMVTSPLITGDPLTPYGIFGLLAVTAGGLYLYRGQEGTAKKANRKGIFIAILASFFFSLNHCFDRLAAQRLNPLMASFLMTLFAALLILPFAVRKEDSVSKIMKAKKILFGRGALEMGFMICKLTALKYLQAPYVVSMTATAMIMSIIGGRFFFGEKELGRRLGAGIIIFAGVVAVLFDIIRN